LAAAFTQPNNVVPAPTPTFDQPFELSGVAQLPSTLTVNGTTLTERLRCGASGVSGTVLTCDTGQTFAEDDTGASPTVEAAPFTDGTDAMRFAKGKFYTDSDDVDVADLTATEDVVVEIVFRENTDVSYSRVLHAMDNITYSGFRTESSAAGSTVLGAYWSDGSASVGLSAACANNSWCHALFFFDRSENSASYSLRAYTNGTHVSSAYGYALFGDVVANTGTYTAIGGQKTDYENTEWSGDIAYVGYSTCDGCFAGGATNATQWLAVAQERFQRLAGAYPSQAGAPLATTLTRASTATIPIHDATDDVIRLHTVGSNWPRIGSWPSGGWGTDPTAAGTSLIGYYAEVGRTNLALQSADITTTWTDIGTSTQTANAIAGPDGATTADAINGVGTAEQGVTQNVTLTAATYIFSTFAKAGVVNFAYLETAIANTSAYFDLTDCTAGTVGAAATASVEDWGGGWCRIGIRYTGTVAAHAHDVQCADSDGGKSYAGTAADCYVWGAQVEQNTRVSSYIATTTATVTRSADVMAFSGGSGNYEYSNGVTLQAKVLSPNDNQTGNASMLQLARPSTTQYFEIRKQSTGVTASTAYSGALVWDIAGSVDVTTGTEHTVIVTALTNDVCMYVDGVVTGTCDTVATVPGPMDSIYIGSDNSSAQQFDGLILSASVYAGEVGP
jgi:hypothetical protein